VVHTFCSEVNGYVSTRFSGPGSTSDRGKNFHAITFFLCVQLYGIRRLRVGTALLNLRTLVSSIRIKLSIIYGRTQGFSPFLLLTNRCNSLSSVEASVETILAVNK